MPLQENYDFSAIPAEDNNGSNFDGIDLNKTHTIKCVDIEDHISAASGKESIRVYWEVPGLKYPISEFYPKSESGAWRMRELKKIYEAFNFSSISNDLIGKSVDGCKIGMMGKYHTIESNPLWERNAPAKKEGKELNDTIPF